MEEKILLFPFQIESHIMALNTIGTELVKEGHTVYTVVHSKIVKRFSQLNSEGLKPLIYKVPAETTTIASVEYQRMWINDVLKGKLKRFYDSMSYRVNKQCDHMELDEGFKGSLTTHKFHLAVIDGVDFALCNYLFVSALDIPLRDCNIFRGCRLCEVTITSFFRAFSVYVKHGQNGIRRQADKFFFHHFLPSLTKQFTPSKYYNFTLFETYRDTLDPDVRSYSDLPTKALMIFITRGYMLETPCSTFTDCSLSWMPDCCWYHWTSKRIWRSVKTLQNFGFVLVSFGTLISYIPDATMQILFDAFGIRKELFLVKYSSQHYF